MTKKRRQIPRKKGSTVNTILESPFENLEKVISHLKTGNSRSGLLLAATDSKGSLKKKKTRNKQFKPIFSKFDEVFVVCQNCGKRSIYNELISGICFTCHNQEELNRVEKQLKESKTEQQIVKLISRLGELETQMKSLENKQQEFTSEDYLSTVIEEISGTVRDSITSNLTQLTSSTHSPSSPSSFKVINPPPPPPPPGAIRSPTQQLTPSATTSHINFSELTLEELSAFSSQTLNSLSLEQRNKYTLRIKELQRLEKMSPAERKAYFQEKTTFKKQHSDRQSVITSLEDLSNPLFRKMKEQADKTILAGKGTFGFFAEKKVFMHCHNCNNTNQIIEGEEATCKFCKSPLSNR